MQKISSLHGQMEALCSKELGITAELFWVVSYSLSIQSECCYYFPGLGTEIRELVKSQ